MSLYTYTVSRDFGFAPNPFYGMCSLATCKPTIRAGAEVGDWVIGTGSVVKGQGGKLIFAMEVNKKITFDCYWNAPEFRFKKPIMNGSTKQKYGDNIYHKDPKSNVWIQEDSHHSYSDGTTNYNNLNRDTRVDKVLVSYNFYYFGADPVKIPPKFIGEFCYNHVGQRKIVDDKHIASFLEWLTTKYSPGLYSLPLLFKSFKRYRGY
ncbi:MAG: hypothetical protein BGO69_18215 [Bacteroidetes bacterium 46-16]|nr:MAG: hypothetical protein BGO69_18215 [Bacteroidetes bacterium 46-16]